MKILKMKLYMLINQKNMKKILLLFIMVFTMHISMAQKGPRERVKALKIAHITEQLDLSSEEAQEFWPIYNTHEKTMEALRKNERKSIRAIKQADGLDNISEKEASDFITSHLTTEEQKLIARKRLISDLKNIIPDKKILKLVKAEMDFNRRLLKQLRDRPRRN